MKYSHILHYIIRIFLQIRLLIDVVCFMIDYPMMISPERKQMPFKIKRNGRIEIRKVLFINKCKNINYNWLNTINGVVWVLCDFYNSSKKKIYLSTKGGSISDIIARYNQLFTSTEAIINRALGFRITQNSFIDG